jgi:hypothetical protein
MGKPVNQNGFSDGRRNPVASQRTFRRQFVTVTDLLENHLRSWYAGPTPISCHEFIAEGMLIMAERQRPAVGL